MLDIIWCRTHKYSVWTSEYSKSLRCNRIFVCWCVGFVRTTGNRHTLFGKLNIGFITSPFILWRRAQQRDRFERFAVVPTNEITKYVLLLCCPIRQYYSVQRTWVHLNVHRVTYTWNILWIGICGDANCFFLFSDFVWLVGCCCLSGTALQRNGGVITACCIPFNSFLCLIAHWDAVNRNLFQHQTECNESIFLDAIDATLCVPTAAWQ